MAITFGLWSFSRKNDEADTSLANTSAEVVVSEPRTSRHAKNVVAKANETTKPKVVSTLPEIRGRLEFLRGGDLYDCRLEIEAVPFMVGRAMVLPAMRPPFPEFFDGYEAAHKVSVVNGEPFRIAVTAVGRYRLMISIEDVKGVLQYWSGTQHWTNAAQTPLSKFNLLDGIKIVHQPREHGRHEVRWRHKTGGLRSR